MGRVTAAVYDAFMSPLEALGLDGLRRELLEPLRGRVLEIGIGTGLTLRHYAEGVELSGLDTDADKLARAGRRTGVLAPTPNLVIGDADALPFGDEAFDAVVISLVLCSVPEPRRTLAEVWRVLKRGGELRALEHVRAPSPFLSVPQRVVTPAWKVLAGGCHLDRDTVGTIAASGFAVVEERPHAAGIFVQVVARRPASAPSGRA
jgi:ubiquinone/menaquinone biosynthesis C-methylase UbiE